MRKTRKYLRKEMSKRGLKFIVFVQCLLFLSPTNLFKLRVEEGKKSLKKLAVRNSENE